MAQDKWFVIYTALIAVQWLILLPIGTRRTSHTYVTTLDLTGVTQCSDDDPNSCVCLYGFQNTLKSCVEATYYSNYMCDVIVDATTGSCTEYQTHTDTKQFIENNLLITICVLVIPLVSAPLLTLLIKGSLELYEDKANAQTTSVEMTPTYNALNNAQQEQV